MTGNKNMIPTTTYVLVDNKVAKKSMQQRNGVFKILAK